MADEWLTTLEREARTRAGIVLYGNVRDLFWSGSGVDYLTLPQLASRRLESFTIRARWDRVDGLQFESEDDARRWTDAVRRSLERATRGRAYDVGAEEPRADVPVSAARYLGEVLAQYRTLLRSRSERPLLIVDWAHLLVSHAAHPDTAERDWMLQLGKALVGEPTQRVDSDHLGAQRGLIVLVSAHLGAVPPILYQGEPRVRLLAVPPPSPKERHAFFARHWDDLRIETQAPGPGTTASQSRENAVETLSELSDQLSLTDLRQAVVLSRVSATPLPPHKLLNLYRFGDQRSPWEDLDERKLDRVEEELKARVLGQEGAVEHVATMVLRASLGLAGLQHSRQRSKPKGTLFFVGPTGVGKTELAKACAQFLFGDESACIRFDMSEYNHEHSDQRLVGAPPGYVGFEDGGQLTNAVRDRPFSVLLFDEIEKAHGRVLDKFLQILEDGRLTDGRGETAWFSESVIIFTSNLGAAEAPANAQDRKIREEHFRSAVERHFVDKLGRPELLNRLGDNVVVFHPIRDDAVRRGIVRDKLRPLREHLQQCWGIGLQLDEDVVDAILQSARSDHGGRGLLNVVEREVLNKLARFLHARRSKLVKGRTLRVRSHADGLEFELRDV